MLVQVILYVFIAKVTMGQLNGEFWWLNDKVAKLKGIESTSVEIENDSEFDTDETDKIVFRDGDLTNEVDAETRTDDDMKINMKFEDQSELIYPTIDNNFRHNISNNYNKIENSDKTDHDVLDFVFPNSVLKFNERNSSQIRNAKELESKTTIKGNICVYMTKAQCHRQSGYVYIPNKVSFDNNHQLICCISALPLKESMNDIRFPEHREPKRRSNGRVYFPNDDTNRHKRSTIQNISPALEQRKFLMLRKYGSRILKTSPTLVPKKTNQKIVTSEEDYADPYWNIKNSNFKKPNKDKISSQSTNTKYDYDYRDYADEYIDELPKPGLVGLYSDHGSKTLNWKFINNKKPYGSNDDYDIDEGEDTFGYGAIDPRLTKNPLRRGPMRLTSMSSDEIDYIAENPAIYYNSNPDFKVLQGFKLLNLVRNKGRVSSKHGRKSTTDSGFLNEGSFVSNPLHGQSSAGYSEKQIYKECGRAVRFDEYENDRQIGEALNGSHPWLALVVLTRQKRSVLCYATILHPRFAITAADCVQGRTTPGEISLVAGLWNLEETDRAQQRMPSVYQQQSRYAARDSEDSLASLHWKRPLRLGALVQPACLEEPRVGNDCFFIGWGGYDQVIQARSRWQRASILTSRQCNSRLLTEGGHINLPDEAFCAAIDSKVSMTGVGGPLVCSRDGDLQAAVVGAAVRRDSVVILVPVRGWAIRAATALDLID